jgi:O-antigen ligase
MRRQSPIHILDPSGCCIGFTLPYYGAETFALHAVGREVVRQSNVDLLVILTNSIRFGEGIWFFGFGLLAIAVGTILFGIAIWKSGILTRWSGIPLAIGFTLFIPQFYTPQPVRIGHGLLVMVGCWLIAWSVLNYRKGSVAPTRETERDRRIT